MMSVTPQAIWYFGRVAASSGFMMANLQRLNGVLMPAFLPIASFVRTAESLISLPAAGIVRTAPTGRDFVSGTFFVQISQSASAGFAAPCATAFAVSIELPPPTARIKSACISTAFFTPSSARASLGFGFTPPSSSKARPSFARDASTRSRRPLRFALPPP